MENNKFMSLINKIKLTKPGRRSIKTALSVFLCIALFKLIGRPGPLIACAMAIISMRETVHYSYKLGVNITIGTFLGGVTGLVFLLLKGHLGGLLHTEAMVAGLGNLTVIYLCNLFNKSGSSIMASLVLLTIVIGPRVESPYLYALKRTMDTFLGVAIALFVNKYILPSKSDDKSLQEFGKS